MCGQRMRSYHTSKLSNWLCVNPLGAFTLLHVGSECRYAYICIKYACVHRAQRRYCHHGQLVGGNELKKLSPLASSRFFHREAWYMVVKGRTVAFQDHDFNRTEGIISFVWGNPKM